MGVCKTILVVPVVFLCWWGLTTGEAPRAQRWNELRVVAEQVLEVHLQRVHSRPEHEQLYLVFEPFNGLGDRLKGSSTAFFLALLLDRKLILNMGNRGFSARAPSIEDQQPPDQHSLHQLEDHHNQDQALLPIRPTTVVQFVSSLFRRLLHAAADLIPLLLGADSAPDPSAGRPIDLGSFPAVQPWELGPRAGQIDVLITNHHLDLLPEYWARNAGRFLQRHFSAQHLHIKCNGDTSFFFLRQFAHVYSMLMSLEPDELFYVYLYWGTPDLSLGLTRKAALSTAMISEPRDAVHVGVHLRVLFERVPKAYAAQCLEDAVAAYCKGQERPCLVFVAADDDDAAAAFLDRLVGHHQLLAFRITGQALRGADGHSDPPDLDPVVVDWWVLSTQEVLFVTRSGFAETANWANPALLEASSLQRPDSPTSACEWKNCLSIQFKHLGWNYC